MNDNKDRLKIVNDLDTNFIVSASAGSGKTSMLVQRMVALVEAGVDISKIAAITFTKKAANEFYTRFYESLSIRSRGEKEEYTYLKTPDELSKKRDEEALKNIDLCFLGTIDSFCNMVLTQYPLEADIPVFSKVCEDEEVLKREIRKELDLCIRGKYGSKLHDLLCICASFLSFEAIIDAVFSMFSGCQYEVNVPDVCSKEYQDTINDFTNKANDLLKSLLGNVYDPSYVVTTKDSNTAWKFLPSLKRKIKGEGLSLIELLICITKLKDLAVNATSLKIDEIVVNSLSRKITKTKDRLIMDKDSFVLSKCNEIKYVYIANFAKEFFKIVEKNFRNKGILTFSTAPVYLNELLKRDDKNTLDIISKISKKYERFLIDEYQDTSPLQNEIFFRITSEDRNPNWKKLHPKPGSLFVVGDPKQGIYHFRGADICSFLEVKKLFEDPKVGEQINLVCNFRSTKGMCESFNKMFDAIMPETTLLQEKYPDIPLDEKSFSNNELEGTYIYKSDGDFDDVVNLVQSLVNSGKTIKGKKIDYSSFMIIPSSKTNLNKYLQAFTNKKIPAFEEGCVQYDLTLIRALYQLLKYIIVRDNLSKIELQASGLFKSNVVTDSLDYDPLNNLFPDEKERKNITSTYSVSQLLEKLISNKVVMSRLPVQGLELVLSINYLLKEKEEQSEIKSPIEALVLINDLIKDSDVERIAPLSSGLPSVKIANLHKVKGLEAPIVILVKSGKVPRLSNSIDVENNKISFMKLSGLEAPSSLYEKEKKYETEYSESEYLRLLYVAATRARQVLFINEQSKTNYWEPLLSFGTDYGEIPADVQKESNGMDIEEAMKDSVSILKDPGNLKPSKTKTYVLDVPSDEKSFSTREDDSEHVYLKEGDAALIGTLVHKLMEIIVLKKDDIIDMDAAIDLITRDIDKIEIKKLLKSVATTIYSGGYDQKNGAPKDILEFAKSGDTYTEVPFSYHDGKHVVSGYIDLVVYLKDEIVIIDYKTDSNIHTKHDSQLAYYEKALALQEKKKVSSYIYNIVL